MFNIHIKTNIFSSSEKQKVDDSIPSEISTCLFCQSKLIKLYYNNKKIIHCARCKKIIAENLKPTAEEKYKQEIDTLKEGHIIMSIIFLKFETWAKDYYLRFSMVLLNFFLVKNYTI